MLLLTSLNHIGIGITSIQNLNSQDTRKQQNMVVGHLYTSSTNPHGENILDV